MRPKKNDIRGHAAMANNSALILLLHRSRPWNNPAGPIGPDGRQHLTDTRARILLDKVRHGANLQFAPLAFDLQPEGKKAQYFDPAAEKLVEAGRFTPDPDFFSA